METRERPSGARGGARERIAITDCEVTLIDAHGFGSGVRGLATLTLNNALVLKSLRIIKDRDGELTVAYPAQIGRDKTPYEVVEPKSESLRGEIARRVLAEYARALEQSEAAEAPEVSPVEPTPLEPAPEPSPEPAPAEATPEEPPSPVL